MKRFMLILFVLIAVSSAVFANGQAADSGDEMEVIEMRFGHYAPVDHPGNLAALQFAENVEKRTNGRINVEVYPANELGSPPEMLEQNILGAIDMSLPTQGALDKYSKKFAVVMLPFVFRDYQHVYDVLDGPFMDWAAPDLDEQGLVFLSNWEYGFRNLTNKVRPVNTPSDVVGLKIRTPPELQLQAAMEALGANVTKIAFNELPLSLKQGVVDGQENPLSVIYHYKLYEVQEYLALTRHVYNSMVHVMSKVTWEKLTAEEQEIVLEESRAAGTMMREAIQAEEADLIKKLEDVGMQVTYPDTALFKAEMQPAYDRIGEYAGQDNVDKFLEMIEMY
jgi:tripartite ATP-independent transporter DctP family solute receptor